MQEGQFRDAGTDDYDLIQDGPGYRAHLQAAG
jgi:hypothetical protein